MAWINIRTVAFGGKESMNRIAFRLDDITPDMNWENFELLDQIFTETKTFPLLGVVPDNRDNGLKKGQEKPDFWQYISQLQKKGYVISQHGYQHIYETQDSGMLGINPFSEFAGLPYEEQKEKLYKGQEILRQHKIGSDIFMAPGHTYDFNTLKALKDLGFAYITDGYTHYPYCYKSLIFYPSTLSGVKIQRGIDTVCLHLNSMNAQEIENIRKFIKDNAQNVCSYTTLLKEEKIRRYTFITALTIRKNLFMRAIKDFAANHQPTIEFMQQTSRMNKIKKICCRILYMPRLLRAFSKQR